MKKLYTLLSIIMILFSLCACASNNSSSKTVKVITVVFGEDGTLYVPNDELSGADEVVYKLEDGTEVSIITEEDLTVTGEHKAEVSYVKDGQEVKHEVKVMSDTKENLIKDNPSEEKTEDDSAKVGDGNIEDGHNSINWNVTVNGVTYGPEEIVNTNLETSLEWLKQIFGDKLSYTTRELYSDGVFRDGIVVHSSTFDDDCSALEILVGIAKKGGFITSDASDRLFEACGLD